MISLRGFSICLFDGTIVSIVCHREDFVVVFGFGAFEKSVGLLEEVLGFLGGGVGFFCFVEGRYGRFVVFSIYLRLRLMKEAGKGGGV